MKGENVLHVISLLICRFKGIEIIHNFLRLVFSLVCYMSSQEAETIYERVARLEDEVATLRVEVDIFKRALRNKIARFEISTIKKGSDVTSIID